MIIRRHIQPRPPTLTLALFMTFQLARPEAWIEEVPWNRLEKDPSIVVPEKVEVHTVRNDNGPAHSHLKVQLGGAAL